LWRIGWPNESSGSRGLEVRESVKAVTSHLAASAPGLRIPKQKVTEKFAPGVGMPNFL
jgi:hypothetical protein